MTRGPEAGKSFESLYFKDTIIDAFSSMSADRD